MHQVSLPTNSPGKNTAVGCHLLLQGIFLTQGSNPRLLHLLVDSLPLSHLGGPIQTRVTLKIIFFSTVHKSKNFPRGNGIWGQKITFLFYTLLFCMSIYTMLLLSCFSHVRLCATPQTTAHQAPLSLGFSRQEYWSGLQFPSPIILWIYTKSCILLYSY